MTEHTKTADRARNTAGVSRRHVLKGTAAITAGALLPEVGPASARPSKAPEQPNVLFILLDQMRYPQVFPRGINSADEFIERFMPNTYRHIWEKGVKFSNYQTASTQCSPSRGVIFTGLYSQQQWLATTLIPNVGNSAAASPPLLAGFPTLGSLLRLAGYDTPYIGKWHCSTPHGVNAGAVDTATDMIGELERYGFRAFIDPDPVALNLEGTYGDDANEVYSDAHIASVAANYLSQRKTSDAPWALSVCFQNPHDQEFFPAGVNWVDTNNLYASKARNPSGYAQLVNYATIESAQAVNYSTNILRAAHVPSYGYPVIPPNWENTATMQANKPGWQVEFRQFSAMYFGGVTDQPAHGSGASFPTAAGYQAGIADGTVAPYPSATSYPGYSLSGNFGIPLAPYSYWEKSLDCYTKIMTVVDQSIGTVLDALPPEVAKNTVIVFTADHGDYAGAHGLPAGKGATVYREAVNVPLIVRDRTGRFTGDTDEIRTQLTSSADLMAMLVSFGYGGKRSWMKGPLKDMYGQRFDMFPLLKSAREEGRQYALFATDEVLSPVYDFVTAPDPTTGLQTPFHVIGLITRHAKLTIYSNFAPGTLTPLTTGQQFEFYDYETEAGRLELDNTYAGNREAARLAQRLQNDLVPNELRAPLPGISGAFQQVAEQAFTDFLDALSGNQEDNPTPLFGFVS